MKYFLLCLLTISSLVFFVQAQESGSACVIDEFANEVEGNETWEWSEEEQPSWCATYNATDCSSETAYQGNKNTTRRGLTCQKWSVQTPHKHAYYHDDNNYCRSTSDQPAPWCYTTDPGKLGDFCFDKCSDALDRSSALNIAFEGKIPGK